MATPRPPEGGVAINQLIAKVPFRGFRGIDEII